MKRRKKTQLGQHAWVSEEDLGPKLSSLSSNGKLSPSPEPVAGEQKVCDGSAGTPGSLPRGVETVLRD